MKLIIATVTIGLAILVLGSLPSSSAISRGSTILPVAVLVTDSNGTPIEGVLVETFRDSSDLESPVPGDTFSGTTDKSGRTTLNCRVSHSRTGWKTRINPTSAVVRVSKAGLDLVTPLGARNGRTYLFSPPTLALTVTTDW